MTKQINLICQVRQELQLWKSKALIYLSALTHKVAQSSVQKGLGKCSQQDEQITSFETTFNNLLEEIYFGSVFISYFSPVL